MQKSSKMLWITNDASVQATKTINDFLQYIGRFSRGTINHPKDSHKIQAVWKNCEGCYNIRILAESASGSYLTYNQCHSQEFFDKTAESKRAKARKSMRHLGALCELCKNDSEVYSRPNGPVLNFFKT